jgi:hypothetical protein
MSDASCTLSSSGSQRLADARSQTTSSGKDAGRLLIRQLTVEIRFGRAAARSEIALCGSRTPKSNQPRAALPALLAGKICAQSYATRRILRTALCGGLTLVSLLQTARRTTSMHIARTSDLRLSPVPDSRPVFANCRKLQWERDRGIIWEAQSRRARTLALAPPALFCFGMVLAWFQQRARCEEHPATRSRGNLLPAPVI